MVKEVRARGDGYWYAYRTHRRHTRKLYLGSAEKLTFADLEQAAQELDGSSVPSSTPFLAPEPVWQLNQQSLTLFASKLSVPRLPNFVIEHSHLLRSLATIHLHPLTLVCAPAGSGKTTLLSS